MKVVLIASAFPKLSETFIVSKFLGLLDRGLDVEVVCQESDRREWDRFPALASRDGIRRRVRVCWPHRNRLLAVFLAPFSLLRAFVLRPAATLAYLRRGWRRFGPAVLGRLYLDSELLVAGPDVLHFEFGTLAAERSDLPELLGCRAVVSFRGFDLNYAGLDNDDYYSRVWMLADAVHCLGTDLWRRAQARGCPPEKPHFLIAPAIDTVFFDFPERRHTAVAGTAERPLRLLAVGRIEWKKGYEFLLSALKQARERGLVFHCRIAGEGEYRDAVAFCRHQHRLDDRVELTGALSRAEIREQMKWADVFVHSAVSEGFCNAVIEAQSMRLPVVCSDADGLGENVADEVTGFIVPRRDTATWTEKLDLLARDPARRRQMGDAGRARACARFTLGDQIEAFSRLYRSVTENPGSRRGRPASVGAGNGTGELSEVVRNG